MKVLLICTSDYMAIPAAMVLQQQGLLCGLVIPRKHDKRLRPSFLQSGFSDRMIYTVRKESMEEELRSVIVRCGAELVLVITFPWKLPASLLTLPVYGCINFHPGLLPVYKGADPIFWQLKNREKEGGFSVHVMTEEIDEGPLLTVRKLAFMHGETYGMHHRRLGMLAADMVMEVIHSILNGRKPEEQEKSVARFFKPPEKHDVRIDWQHHGSEDIECLVNATNPKYNGAFTSIRNTELSILEVGFAQVANAPDNMEPGTIVYADALYGLLVACADGRIISINTVCLPEGYYSGTKLFHLGFTVGERFS